MKLLKIISLCFALCISQLAVAADNIKLTPNLVEQWLSSYQEIMTWSQENSADLDELENMTGEFLSIDDMSAVEHHPLYKEFSQKLAQQGFSDPKYWSDVAERVMLTYMLNMDPNIKESFAQLGFLQDMLENTDLPEEQKLELKQQVEQLKDSAIMLDDISPEEQQAVEKFAAQLEGLMEDQEQY